MLSMTSVSFQIKLNMKRHQVTGGLMRAFVTEWNCRVSKSVDSIKEHFHKCIYLSKYPPPVSENRYVNKWKQDGTILLTHSTLKDNVLVLLSTVTDALLFSATAENRLQSHGSWLQATVSLPFHLARLLHHLGGRNLYISYKLEPVCERGTLRTVDAADRGPGQCNDQTTAMQIDEEAMRDNEIIGN
jgi:hypothetical protein